MRLCRLIYAPCDSLPSSSEKPIHLQGTRLPLQKTGYRGGDDVGAPRHNQAATGTSGLLPWRYVAVPLRVEGPLDAARRLQRPFEPWFLPTTASGEDEAWAWASVSEYLSGLE